MEKCRSRITDPEALDDYIEAEEKWNQIYNSAKTMSYSAQMRAVWDPLPQPEYPIDLFVRLDKAQGIQARPCLLLPPFLAQLSVRIQSFRAGCGVSLTTFTAGRAPGVQEGGGGGKGPFFEGEAGAGKGEGHAQSDRRGLDGPALLGQRPGSDEVDVRSGMVKVRRCSCDHVIAGRRTQRHRASVPRRPVLLLKLCVIIQDMCIV